jgi:hypothetical protein
MRMTASRRSMNAQRINSVTRSRFKDGWAAKSKSSKVFTVGKRAAFNHDRRYEDSVR